MPSVSTLCTAYLNGHKLFALPVALGDLAAVLVDAWRGCSALQALFCELKRPGSGNLSEAIALKRVFESDPSSLRSVCNAEGEDEVGVEFRS